MTTGAGFSVPLITWMYQGAVAASGSMYVYQTGTTTLVSIYADAGLTTPLSNPVNLDSNGQAVFYVSGQTNLRLDGYTGLAGAGTLIKSIDPVYPVGTASGFTTEATLASATTTDLGTASSSLIDITGTTTITGFGSSASLSAPLFFLRFSGSLTLTYDATKLILPWQTNIITAAGDTCVAQYLGSGNWKVLSYNPISGLPTGFKNAIINGSFRKWDYATTYTLTNSVAYGSANRWAVVGPNSAGIFNRDTSITAGLGFQYNAKLGRNSSSASTTAIAMAQALESINSIPMAGQTVTLSYYAKAGANYSSSGSSLSVKLSTGTGTDQSAANLVAGSWTSAANAISATDTLTTSWQRFAHTVTLGSSITQLGVQFGYTPSGTAGSDDNIYITGIQLELGQFATAFEQRSFGIENLLCARYLPVWISDSTNYNIGSCDFASSTVLLGHLNLAVPARVDATGIVVSGTGIIAGGVAGTVFTSTAIAFGNASNVFMKLSITTSGGTGGQGGQLYLNASGAYIYATGCEL